jgi:hypothetical protein
LPPLEKLVSLTLSPRSLVERDPKEITAADFLMAGIAGTNGPRARIVEIRLPRHSRREPARCQRGCGGIGSGTLRTTGDRDVVVALP